MIADHRRRVARIFGNPRANSGQSCDPAHVVGPNILFYTLAQRERIHLKAATHCCR